MPLPPNRIKVFTSTNGQGASVVLGAAVSTLFCDATEGGLVDGVTYDYVIEQGGSWEENSGVYTLSGTTIARGTPVKSKINGSVGTDKINMVGTAIVYFPSFKSTIEGAIAAGVAAATIDGGTF